MRKPYWVISGQVFSTAADNQPAVSIHVLQGEREMASGNRTLGQFQLIGIPSAPRGVPQIEVTFDIDADGIVNVSAKDLGTGKEQAITIESSSSLSKDEIETITKEAERFRDEDKKKREVIEEKNGLDSLIFNVERTLSENKDKLDGGLVSELENELESARSNLESDNAETLRASSQALEKAAQKMAESLYQSTSATNGEAPPSSPTEKDSGDEVVDAEFTEVN